jgi:putative Ca2+/H+ antiporter (TMEM165/GDT1 family)
MPTDLAIGLSVFAVIFLLELPDKTALATLLMASRLRPLPVFGGTAIAFLIQSLVAVFAGSLLGFLPRAPVRIVAGLAFVVVAAVLVRRNFRRQAEVEQQEIVREERHHRGPFVTAFLVVFIAEWGDLTQLATAALQARYQRVVPVLVASTLALWSVSALAIVVGNRLGALIPQRPLELVAAAITAVIGILLISGLVG